MGSTEKSSMKPATEATRRGFEQKLLKRWLFMKSKSLENSKCKPGSVGIWQMSMVIRDLEKIEHVLNRCWDFFTTWCKSSIIYKKMFRDGEPDKTEIELQTDCFRNGSIGHKTISQCRRSAEIVVMHQCLLERDPFNIDI